MTSTSTRTASIFDENTGSCASSTTVAQTIVDAVSLGCLYALFALGIALIFGVMGLINFAHGELAMVGAYVAAYLASIGDVGLAAVAVVAVVALALVMERVAFRPLRGAAPATLLVASFGLLATIWGVARRRATAVPFAVAAYIVAGYWFTASTSFANPAVTLARAASDTFAGIRPADAPAFIVAQLLGASAATLLFRWLAPALPQVAPDIMVPHSVAPRVEEA